MYSQKKEPLHYINIQGSHDQNNDMLYFIDVDFPWQ